MKKCLSVGLMLVLMAGCASGIKVNNDYDPTADFASYKQYAWYPSKQTVPADAFISELVVQRIERAIDSGLVAKNLQPVPAGKEQFQVRVYLVIEDKLDVQTWNASYGYGRYNDPWGWNAGTETTITQYQQGTLIIDFVDAKTHKLVWRGTAASRLRQESSPEERQARVNEVVTAILSQYPPMQTPEKQ